MRATCFEDDGKVFQRPVEYSDIDIEFQAPTSAEAPASEARARALAIQRNPMPFSGPLFRYAILQIRAAEYSVFGCVHRIVMDAAGIELFGNRVAAV